MRPFMIALASVLLAPLAAGGDALYDEIAQDKVRAKELEKGLDALRVYYKYAAQEADGNLKAILRKNEAMNEFLNWLKASKGHVKVDLQSHPTTVIEMFDRARVDTLVRPKSRGRIDYVRVENVQGMERLEYATLVPKTYDRENDERYPLVLSLHERVINQKHPAFKNNMKIFTERSRAAVFNNWFKSKAADGTIVVGPTGNPNGFTFDKDPFGDRQVVFRALGAAMSDYRVDWDRVFLELHGSAIRVACQQTFVFAGFIVRDREDDRRKPLIPPEQLFMLDNLNGVPFCYVADEAHWERVGKPLSEALRKAYEKAGKTENLLLLKGKRDANGALRGDEDAIVKFIDMHRRPASHKKFRWRFFDSGMTSPLPIVMGLVSFQYDDTQPLETTAGALEFAVSLEREKDEKGAEIDYNLVDMKITEAESLELQLYDGLVDLDLPVSVRINGKLIHDKVEVKRNWRSWVRDVLPLRAFMFSYVTSLSCEFEAVPQYEVPVVETPPAETPVNGKEGEGESGEKEGAGATEPAKTNE